MASFNNISSPPANYRHLTELIENLSTDDQRMLARILNNWETRDQRKLPRTPCSIITEYTVDSQFHKGTMKNISSGGAYFENQPLFPVDQKILQSFFVPNFEIPIQSESEIIWVGTKGFGVQFKRFVNQFL